MQPDVPLPPFNDHGYLPSGIHDTTLEAVRERFVVSPDRVRLWSRFEAFMKDLVSADKFSHVYIDGGFITTKSSPEDIDVILQPLLPFGKEVFDVIEPIIFRTSPGRLHDAVHVHFHFEGKPEAMSDFRAFFQYLKPQDAAPLGLKEGSRKGIVRITL